MALWNVDGEIVYAEGSLSLTPEKANAIFVTRHRYKVPYSNINSNGFKGTILTTESGTFHTPSWTKVHPKTTIEDVFIDKKPFEELFVEERKWEFKSGSSNKTYTVKYNKHGNLSCDCMGYIGHRKCKHITEVKEKI